MTGTILPASTLMCSLRQYLARNKLLVESFFFNAELFTCARVVVLLLPSFITNTF